MCRETQHMSQVIGELICYGMKHYGFYTYGEAVN